MEVQRLTEEDVKLTLEEFAILAFTNQNSFESLDEDESFHFVSTYDSYYLALVAVDYVWQENNPNRAFSYSDRSEEFISLLEKVLTGYIDEKEVNSPGDSDKYVLYSMLSDLLRNTNVYPDISTKYGIEKAVLDLTKSLNKRVNKLVKGLTKNNLIVDPIVEYSLGVAILGFIPYKITKRTEHGETTYRSIKAGYWSWTYQKTSTDSSEVQFEFIDLQKRFKKLIEILHTTLERRENA